MREKRDKRAVVLAAALACASSVAGCSHSPDEFPDPDLPAVPTNPDGLPYPTDHIGSVKHSPGHSGDRIPNLTFRAYRDGVAGGLQTISLAEFYDPQMKRNKVLDIQVAATWCAICDDELSHTVQDKDALLAQGIVFLEVVLSGETAGKGPSLAEMTEWVERHQTNFPSAIDVRGRRLGALGVNTLAVPYDIVIDTRSMEILDSSVGAPADVSTYYLEAVKFVNTNPPAYAAATR
jgi:hypothetical protein